MNVRAIQFCVFASIFTLSIVKLLSACEVFKGYFWPYAYAQMIGPLFTTTWSLIVVDAFVTIVTLLFGFDQMRAKFRVANRSKIIQRIGPWVVAAGFVDSVNFAIINCGFFLAAMILSSASVLLLGIVLGVYAVPGGETTVTEHNVWRLATTSWLLYEIYLWSLNISSYEEMRGNAHETYASWGIIWLSIVTIFLISIFGFMFVSWGPFFLWIFILIGVAVRQWHSYLSVGILSAILSVLSALFIIILPIFSKRIREQIIVFHDKNMLPPAGSDVAAFPAMK